MRKPYGFLSFYGPVVIGVTINWILFPFIARVIIASGKLESEQTNMSDIKVKTGDETEMGVTGFNKT